MARKKIASPIGSIKIDRKIVQDQNIKQHITILPELEALIPPLTNEEVDLLEESILKEGCREPLTIWERIEDGETQFVLIDGHNRYRICQKNKVEFKLKKPLYFDTKEQVKDYMIDLQLGRRNLTEEQKSYLRGLRYNNEKGTQGGTRSQETVNKKKELSEQYGVSERTIMRDAQFAAGLDRIGNSNPQLKADILSGNRKVKRNEVQALAQAEEDAQIASEKDISNVVGQSNAKSLSDEDKQLMELKKAFNTTSKRLFTKKDKDAVSELNDLLRQIEELL
ncbi:ParB N-terminal domain-containing protein [Limibacter armeniacum]|uniref:ParB N-terminal domain-containing protein n=1 Tax=Limibacter armeniacum TaxID=466084 RepID=UPI002FE54D75